MDLKQKIAALPAKPGVYLYRDAEGEILYVGKARDLRARVKNYLLGASLADAKTGSLMREAADVEAIVVANEAEALALENNLIKRHKPRFNILLRDDKTYPYIRLTHERFPRVYVTRRLREDGSRYFGPYFPASLAHRLVDLIHRHFLVPSCRVDLTRYHPRPCLQYHIKRCLGPCVKDLTTPEVYTQAVQDVTLFLEGRNRDLTRMLEERMAAAAEEQQYEQAARLRDLISTVAQLHEKQRMAAVEGDDADVLGYHLAGGQLAVNLFHVRNGRVLDRREHFWDSLPAEGAAFEPGAFLSSLLKQLYIGQPHLPRTVLVPVDFEDREELARLLSEERKRILHDARAAGVAILVPERGEKRSLLDLVAQNARLSHERRFRVSAPTGRDIQSSLQDALDLPRLPRRIECFDISHLQGAETVASLVVWREGKMDRSSYRRFIIRTAAPGDDFAAMQEVVTRRFRRLKDAKEGYPDLVLVDGGLGQLHAATAGLESLQIADQPLAALAKKEEVLYLRGEEKHPIVLERHSPVLHLVQHIRDESHRFALAFHRKRRQIRGRSSELLRIPGVGPQTMRRLLEHFGSLRGVQEAPAASLAAVVNARQARAIRDHFQR